MLVLTRKTDEGIIIGGEIRVTVLGFTGEGKVRLGVDAPRTVKILRSETLEQTREANKVSAASGMNLSALLKSAAEEEPQG